MAVERVPILIVHVFIPVPPCISPVLGTAAKANYHVMHNFRKPASYTGAVRRKGSHETCMGQFIGWGDSRILRAMNSVAVPAVMEESRIELLGFCCFLEQP